MEQKDLLTERKFWEDYWNNKRDELIGEVEQKGYQHRELDTIIANKHIASIIELGGFPGTFSVYVKKKYNLETALVDYFIDRSIVEDLLLANKLEKDSIHLLEDDLTLTHEITKKFDLVYSLGLIEHFKDTKGIIQRHLDFLQPGGELLIIIPNFRGINGWLQRKFNRPNYDVHNIACMDIDFLKSVAKELKIENVSVYYMGKFSIWLDNIKEQSVFVKVLVKMLFVLGKVATKIIPVDSKLFSPFIVIRGNSSKN